MNHYTIPIDLISKQNLIVEARSQTEAIKKLKNMLANNPEKFDEVKIRVEDIECAEDDKMFEEMVKDKIVIKSETDTTISGQSITLKK